MCLTYHTIINQIRISCYTSIPDAAWVTLGQNAYTFMDDAAKLENQEISLHSYDEEVF